MPRRPWETHHGEEAVPMCRQNCFSDKPLARRLDLRGDPVRDQIKAHGFGVHVFKNDESVISGIDQLKSTLATSVFDAENCKDGLNALENYKMTWNEDRKAFSDSLPKHDWTSHYADSARYAARAAIHFRNLINQSDEIKPLNISFV